MQVILDSSFASPGSAPIWGGKKKRVQGLDYALEYYSKTVKIKILRVNNSANSRMVFNPAFNMGTCVVDYRRIPKVTPLVTFGFSRQKRPSFWVARYLQVAATFGWSETFAQ